MAFFQDFPVLENAIIKFQDFPGFRGPVRTLMASNAKKKCKLVKKHLGWGNFVLFSNSENIPLFLSLNKIHATKYMQGYILSVSFSHYFNFLLFESKLNVKFCHKNFSLRKQPSFFPPGPSGVSLHAKPGNRETGAGSEEGPLFSQATKFFCYQSFPIITGHGTENVLLLKHEIL